jgi:Uma2 family endonuclease
MMTLRPAATEEDLMRTPEDGWRHELVDGQVRRIPGGARHGLVCVKLGARILGFVQELQLGYVVGSNTGFRFPGGNVRVPDVTFTAKGRFPGEQLPEGFSDVPPDLAVEVLAPDDRAREVLDKVGEYLQAGVRLVWVIDPQRRTAAVYRSLTNVRQLGAQDFLDGEDVLPGFRCRLDEAID